MDDITQPIYWILALGFIVLAWLIGTWNRFVRLRNMIRESWSNVDVALQRRHDLIPNLVETVKGYAKHEQEVLARLVEAREHAMRRAPDLHQRKVDEEELVRSVNTVMARAEAYPDLKASQQFLELQRELTNTEDRIAAARRFFNSNIREYNTAVHSFPASIVAGMQKAHEMEFFEISSLAARENPSVQS